MSTNRAIGYIRVSTRDQADSGASLASQRTKIEAYAVLHDLELIEVIENAGFSAKSLDRPGMTNLLRLIRGRKIGVVIVAKLDRITRSVRDLGELDSKPAFRTRIEWFAAMVLKHPKAAARLSRINQA